MLTSTRIAKETVSAGGLPVVRGMRGSPIRVAGGSPINATEMEYVAQMRSNPPLEKALPKVRNVLELPTFSAWSTEQKWIDLRNNLSFKPPLGP
jgi:hypothetical protein